MNKSRTPATKDTRNTASPYERAGLPPGRVAGRYSREESVLALNSDYLNDPEATIIHRIDNPGFDEPRVSEGDLVVADRRVTPYDGRLVIATIDGERVVRLFFTSGGHEFLCTGPESCEAVEITADAQVEILATVVSVIPVISGS